ncbi:hypothetical protein D7X99_25600 [Corallococcus sp. AB032C]|uniref:hypothetical protein n=2 Tax=Myxococcaceae TaxID=31 RepID=UPI000EDB066A|nr:hypothetical protein [Corallococcus exiguus]MBN8470259.1 hypothetical protein [Corallococcus exiguus]RKH79254.1 hypothetical protein D7X99_25600 [Corallococcus sp. AB032C]
MHMSQAQEELEAAWSDEDGFLVQLRMGNFDSAKADALLTMLKRMDLGGSGPLERRVVSLLWYLPLFMSWQRERVEPKRLIELAKVEALATNEVERLLGVP